MYSLMLRAMKKFYYLSSCSTCKRIMQSLELPDSVEMVDIKKNPLNSPELEQLRKQSGSYEALFSKRAQLYKQRNLKDQNLTEEDLKGLLLEHYTFLKRPILWSPSAIHIGNSASVVEAMKAALHE